MKKLLFTSLFISSFIQADTYLFCKADKSLNASFEFEEYTAIQLFDDWKTYVNGQYSGGCQNEFTHFDSIMKYPKQNIKPKFKKGAPYCGENGPPIKIGDYYSPNLIRTKYYRDTESITWTNIDDLYDMYLSRNKEKVTRILNRETLILTENKKTGPLISQCEVTDSYKSLKKKMKEAGSSLLKAQIKTNEAINKARKETSEKNKKTSKQQI